MDLIHHVTGEEVKEAPCLGCKLVCGSSALQVLSTGFFQSGEGPFTPSCYSILCSCEHLLLLAMPLLPLTLLPFLSFMLVLLLPRGGVCCKAVSDLTWYTCAGVRVTAWFAPPDKQPETVHQTLRYGAIQHAEAADQPVLCLYCMLWS